MHRYGASRTLDEELAVLDHAIDLRPQWWGCAGERMAGQGERDSGGAPGHQDAEDMGGVPMMQKKPKRGELLNQRIKLVTES